MQDVYKRQAVLGMGGCGKADQPASADNGGTGAKTAEASIELSVFAGSIAENTPTGTGLKAMVDYMNENGGGTLKATDYYDTALGDATSMVQGLQQGTIDIGVSGTAYFSGLVPEVEVFQLPFLFDDLEEARAAAVSYTHLDVYKRQPRIPSVHGQNGL